MQIFVPTITSHSKTVLSDSSSSLHSLKTATPCQICVVVNKPVTVNPDGMVRPAAGRHHSQVIPRLFAGSREQSVNGIIISRQEGCKQQSWAELGGGREYKRVNLQISPRESNSCFCLLSSLKWKKKMDRHLFHEGFENISFLMSCVCRDDGSDSC